MDKIYLVKTKQKDFDEVVEETLYDKPRDDVWVEITPEELERLKNSIIYEIEYGRFDHKETTLLENLLKKLSSLADEERLDRKPQVSSHTERLKESVKDE
jgi:hypothetical protein